jgi:hypothetical protein
MTNEFNWGFTHNSILIDETGTVLRTNTSGINLPELYPSAVQNNYLPAVNFNGTRISATPSIGTADAPFINYNTTIDLSDNLTKVWGSHTIKGGIYLQRSRKNQTSFASFNGSYNFGDNASNPYDTGSDSPTRCWAFTIRTSRPPTTSMGFTGTGISSSSWRTPGRLPPA